MFKIKYYLDKSEVHGIGIFSGEFIKKGQTIYFHNEKFSCQIPKEEFENFSDEDKRIFSHYGYFNKKENKWFLDYDDIRFCNHSENGNMTFDGGKIFAKRDIQKDEELLQDYHEFGGKLH